MLASPASKAHSDAQMRIPFRLAIAALLLATVPAPVVFAQTYTRGAAQSAERDALFARLSASTSAAEAQGIADTIWVIWTQPDDPVLAARVAEIITAGGIAGPMSQMALIDQLIAQRKIHPCLGALLKAEVRSVQMLIARGKKPAAIALLRGMIAELDLLVRYRLVKAADVAPLRNVLLQAMRSLSV